MKSDDDPEPLSRDTITAQATPPGRGGVGIVRISGPAALAITERIIGVKPQPRLAEYHSFLDPTADIIDMGLVLFFPNPHSFTGEDVVEFQGHGSPVVMDRLLRCITHHGARIAKPGEFSERAFLNNKIDLTQAEAIADLIDSASEQAARSAIRSLQGDFSKQIHDLVENITHLRMYVEAAIDFPEEEIDFLADDKVSNDLIDIIEDLDTILLTAKQGTLLREGMTVVIAGKPNAGKSSLLNCLSGRESAIIAEIPGTTRDLLREHILIDGIPLHIIDTAGLRETDDPVEQEGVRRAWREVVNADQVLLVVDGRDTTTTEPEELWPDFNKLDLSDKKITVIRNKADLTQETVGLRYEKELCVITLAAKKGLGIDVLRDHLKECVGAKTQIEGGFIARSRHIDALKRARTALTRGADQLASSHAGELLAEDLRQSQQILGEITGVVTPDDLLGKIFSSFCIGK
jgi:tRNA modification GTPase